MRTVVFSDDRAALAFNARFISVWENRDSDTKFLDDPPKPEKVLYQSDEDLPLGTGATNVISIFATPEGHILNAVPGYLGVEALLDEMRLALAVRKLALDEHGDRTPDAQRSYIGLHRAAAQLYGCGVPAQAHEILALSGMGMIGKNRSPAYASNRSTAFCDLFSPLR